MTTPSFDPQPIDGLPRAGHVVVAAEQQLQVRPRGALSQDDSPLDLRVLRVLAATLDDLEKMRIMSGNRIAAAQHAYGDALPHLHEAFAPLLDAEHRAELMLKRVWRRHPLAPWARTIPGCGEKLIARLVALTGEPSLRAVGHWAASGTHRRLWVVDGYEERTAAQLVAYCGHGDPVRSVRRPGMTQEELFKQGNPAAKQAAWKLGYQFMRTPGSPYRTVYLSARERYADKRHVRTCHRCGPPGRPALPGAPWSENHKHHAAIRNTTHLFLTDLWRESRRLRGLSTTTKRGRRAGHGREADPRSPFPPSGPAGS